MADPPGSDTPGIEAGELTVSQASGYPQLGVSARYLRQAEIDPGDTVTVKAAPGAVLVLAPGADINVTDDASDGRPIEELDAIWTSVTGEEVRR